MVVSLIPNHTATFSSSLLHAKLGPCEWCQLEVYHSDGAKLLKQGTRPGPEPNLVWANFFGVNAFKTKLSQMWTRSADHRLAWPKPVDYGGQKRYSWGKQKERRCKCNCWCVRGGQHLGGTPRCLCMHARGHIWCSHPMSHSYYERTMAQPN